MSYGNKSIWDTFMGKVLDEMVDGFCKEYKTNKEFRDNVNEIGGAAWEGAKKGVKDALWKNDKNEKNHK